MFRDCKECGAKCCRFFGIPADYRDVMHESGVPMEIYQSDLEPDPSHYFSLREGITIRGGHIIVDEGVPTREMNTRLGRNVIVYSRCKALAEDDSCSIYEQRPESCRNFVARTAHLYFVPAGCIFDPGGLGEQYGV